MIKPNHKHSKPHVSHFGFEIVTLNSVMLGALAFVDALSFSKEVLRNALVKCAPAALVDANVRALELGYEACRSLVAMR